MGPHGGAHRVALRVAISLGVPLLLLFALDRLDLSVYASFGAFASLYGRFDPFRTRAVMQLEAGALQVAALLIGTGLALADAPTAARIGVVAVVAVGAIVVSNVRRWHPPGAIFAVFASGATASMPASDGALLRALVVGAASVAFTLLVTTAFAAARRGLAEGGPMPTRPLARGILLHATTVAVAAVASGTAALALVGSHWYWAMVAAVAAMSRPAAQDVLVRGSQRLVGTLGGVAVAAGLFALHLPPLATIAAALVAQAGAELFIGRNYAVALLFITPLALLMVQLAAPTDTDTLLLDRALDTAIGVVVATIIGLVASRWIFRPRAS